MFRPDPFFWPPESMEKIQRLSLILCLTEYPQTQDAILKYLASLPHEDLGGKGGTDMEFHEMIALTDTEDPVGYYGINLYFGDNNPGKEHEPLIARTEVFFQPAFTEKFFTSGQFIFKGPHPSRSIEAMRVLMRKLKCTPSEFVQQMNEDGVLPKQIINEAKSRHSEPLAPIESPKK